MLELILLIGGIWSIAAGKVPPFISGKKYRVEGVPARVLGVIMILPLPVALLGYSLIFYFFGRNSTSFGFSLLLEFVLVMGDLILVSILSRILGTRVDQPGDIKSAKEAPVESEAKPESKTEMLIADKAKSALMCALFCAIGVSIPVFLPLTFVFAGQGMRLIKEHGIGEEHRTKLQASRIVAVVITLGWAASAVCAVPVLRMGM